MSRATAARLTPFYVEYFIFKANSFAAKKKNTILADRFTFILSSPDGTAAPKASATALAARRQPTPYQNASRRKSAALWRD